MGEGTISSSRFGRIDFPTGRTHPYADRPEGFSQSGHNPFTELDKDISKIPPSRSTGDVPIRAIWTKGDDVSARAVARFFRRLNKLTTNKLSRVDRTSLEVVQRVEKGGWMHVCPKPLEWSRTRPQNFIERQWKPIDWAPPQLGA